MNIKYFFAGSIISFPSWMVGNPTSSSLVTAYCIMKAAGLEMTEEDFSQFAGGSTPNKIMDFLREKGLEVNIPSEITHETIAKGLDFGVFTVLTFSKAGHTNGVRISFVKNYDQIHDRIIFFEQSNEEGFELGDLDIFHYFTVRV